MAPPKPEEEAYVAARESLTSAKGALASKVEGGSKDIAELDGLVEALEKALKAVADAKGPAKPKPNPAHQKEEDDAKKLITDAQAASAALAEEKKKSKDAARKKLMGEAAKAAPLTGDLDALKAAVEEAQACDVAEKELNEPQKKLQEMISFHFMLKEATNELQEAAQGAALKVDLEKLEAVITEHKAGAVAKLNKVRARVIRICSLRGPAQGVAHGAARRRRRSRAPAPPPPPPPYTHTHTRTRTHRFTHTAHSVLTRRSHTPPSHAKHHCAAHRATFARLSRHFRAFAGGG